MGKILQAVWEDNFSRLSFMTAVFFWLTSLFLLALFWHKLPPQVPLFYSHPWGEEQLALPIFLFLLPGGVFLILVCNLILASFLSEEKLILRTLVLASLICAFLGFFGLVKILSLSL